MNESRFHSFRWRLSATAAAAVMGRNCMCLIHLYKYMWGVVLVTQFNLNNSRIARLPTIDRVSSRWTFVVDSFLMLLCSMSTVVCVSRYHVEWMRINSFRTLAPNRCFRVYFSAIRSSWIRHSLICIILQLFIKTNPLYYALHSYAFSIYMFYIFVSHFQLQC